MTVLTRMPLNPARRGTRALLGSPQAMHAAVLAAFPPHEDRSQRVLWRVDRDATHSALLYLLSPTQPDLTHLVEQAGWPTISRWESRDYEPLLNRLKADQQWAFRLTANPVRRVRPEGGGRGKVKAHITAAQQATWLLDRADNHGFHIATDPHGEPAVAVRERRSLRFPRQNQTVSLATATFEGVLEVRDAAALRSTLIEGLGRAKGYGCGLLTLAPLQGGGGSPGPSPS